MDIHDGMRAARDFKLAPRSHDLGWLVRMARRSERRLYYELEMTASAS